MNIEERRVEALERIAAALEKLDKTLEEALWSDGRSIAEDVQRIGNSSEYAAEQLEAVAEKLGER